MHFLRFTAVAVLLSLAPVAAPAQEAAQQQTTVAAGVDDFARAAAQNSMSEVLMSAMALQKTDDKRVQDYAWTMLDHHARAMGDLAEALSPGAALLPTEPSAEQAAILERMRGLDGKQFDDAYFVQQLDAHGRAIEAFEQGARVPDDAVARYATNTLPILLAHREIAKLRQGQPVQPMPGQ